MAKFSFLKQIRSPRSRQAARSFGTKHSDKLLLGAQIGGGLVGTYGALRGANAFIEETEELGNKIKIPIVIIGGFIITMLLM